MNHQDQRRFATEVVQQLREAGYESLWAGGCVRDELLGRPPNDYDVATSARPEQVRVLFGHRRTLAIGAAFGVISVLGRKGSEPIEVATFRSDGAYEDGRHPSDVTFTSAEEDAKRRDFTINGMFYDPLNQRLVDYVGGEQDLQAGIVRAIGNPIERFTEDKLRMLRAVRFATTFEFALDEATRDAIRSMADEVTVVSAERIGVELRKTLRHPQRGSGVQLLRETGLLRPLFPTLAEIAAHDVGAWNTLVSRLQALSSDSFPAAFAALFCFSGAAEDLRGIGRGFRFTNKEIDRAAWLLEQLPMVEQATELPWPQLQRVLIHDGVVELLALAVASLGEQHEGVQACRKWLELPLSELNPPLLLTGDDLVAHGLKPGKYFGQLLTQLRDAQLEKAICDRGTALRWVDQWMQENSTT